jgi:predicted ATPase
VEAEFPDGAWFVELGDLRQPDLVVSRVAAVVGVSEEPGRPLLETLGEALRSRRLLLGLDTCEHLIDACAHLSQHLVATSPGLSIVMTSREPVRIAAETIWRVPPLALVGAETGQDTGNWDRDEAVRLFADRAARYRPGFAVGPDNAATISSICRALDGLPLAIELAAARVRVLSVEQISAFLSNVLELLIGGDRSAPMRQRTLGAAIEWSYDTLTIPERTLFRRLSVFAGWSLEMAQQVCADADIAADNMLDLTTALVDKSLAVLEPRVCGLLSRGASLATTARGSCIRPVRRRTADARQAHKGTLRAGSVSPRSWSGSGMTDPSAAAGRTGAWRSPRAEAAPRPRRPGSWAAR